MRFNCTAAAAAVLPLLACAAIATAQPAPAAAAQPAPGEAVFNVYVHGAQIGSETVTLSKDNSGWIIESSGRDGEPVDFILDRFEMKYGPDWQPMELHLEASVHGAPIALATSFGVTTAINEITQNEKTVAKEDQISARTIVIPNNVFGAYEALAARLWPLQAGTELPIYVAAQVEIKLKVKSVMDQVITGAGKTIPTRRFEVTIQNPKGPVAATVTVDDRQRLVRFEIPEVGLIVSRDDAASVAMRASAARNPTDVDVSIPSNGFSLAGTLTTPRTVAGKLRYPAIVLVGSATPVGRDNVIDGVPVFTRLAQAFADAGVITLRYDRRGGGQSGGRLDTVTLNDYADDAVSVVKWMSKRDDVDRKRLVVMGLGEGGSVAILAAGRDKEITGIIAADAPGTPGSDFLLQQQERVLAGLNLTDSEKQARVALQTKIQNAVITGNGWEGVPPVMRRQAETSWFRSLLLYDPSNAIARARQPILIVQADQDIEVPSAEAGKLEDLAKKRQKTGAPEVVHLPDAGRNLTVDHALAPKLVPAIVEWLKKL